MDKAVEIIETETIHQGFLDLTRYRLRHRLFGGGWSPELIRERVEGLRAASVLLYDPERDVVVLIEQFRIGTMGSENGAWVLETVGGYVPPEEEPDAVARREVKEETGCDVGELVPICEFFVSPGFSTERISLFCGHVDAGDAAGVHGLDEEGEDILVRVLSADDAIAGIGRDGIDSTSVIIGLQWLTMNRGALKQRWLQR